MSQTTISNIHEIICHAYFKANIIMIKKEIIHAIKMKISIFKEIMYLASLLILKFPDFCLNFKFP